MKKQPRDGNELQPSGRSEHPRRRGASAVEFAIVAPIFFMLIFGMFEFGRMLMVQQLLTNGARSGSRIAVIDGATSEEVISTVQDYLQGGSIDESAVTITVEPSDLAETATGDPITVRLSVPFQDVSWLPSPSFLMDTTLKAHSTMRRE
jgi:hypothetical protein